MEIPETAIGSNHLTIEKFREMDYLSVDKYKISIELMMENAGLHLARLAVNVKPASENVLIGIGAGNNGGGGLVAARRLAAWGYNVYLDIPNEELPELPQLQLERALACGAKMESVQQPGIFIDAYLGFSQRLPLSETIQKAVDKANRLVCTKISLDLPTGFEKTTSITIFKPDIILTLAAMKTELIPLLTHSKIYLADLGLPKEVYTGFGIEQPKGFSESGIVKCYTN